MEALAVAPVDPPAFAVEPPGIGAKPGTPLKASGIGAPCIFDIIFGAAAPGMPGIAGMPGIPGSFGIPGMPGIPVMPGGMPGNFGIDAGSKGKPGNLGIEGIPRAAAFNPGMFNFASKSGLSPGIAPAFPKPRAGMLPGMAPSDGAFPKAVGGVPDNGLGMVIPGGRPRLGTLLRLGAGALAGAPPGPPGKPGRAGSPGKAGSAGMPGKAGSFGAAGASLATGVVLSCVLGLFKGTAWSFRYLAPPRTRDESTNSVSFLRL